MGLRKIVSSNVKKIRKQLKMTQIELSNRSGLSTKYIQDVENQAKNLSADSMDALAKGLGIPTLTLLVEKIETTNGKEYSPQSAEDLTQ